MLIALPNKDGSFTLTLFLPFAALERIQTRDEARKFFQDNFPDALGLVGETLLDDFEKNPRGNLVTINVGRHDLWPFFSCFVLMTGLSDFMVLARASTWRRFTLYGPVSTVFISGLSSLNNQILRTGPQLRFGRRPSH
jgi:hypothetical protein